MSSREGRGRVLGRVVLRGLRFVEHGFAVIGVLFLTYHLVFDLSVMGSNSMSPTLRGTSVEDGDWVLTEKLTCRLRGARRWEVLAFDNQDGMQVMKRVVGLPGETVSLKDNSLLVDGAPVTRPEPLKDIRYLAYGKLHRGREAECGEGYFVLGDDSTDSWDSRYEGPVGPDRITGRPWLVVWPPSRIGFVNP